MMPAATCTCSMPFLTMAPVAFTAPGAAAAAAAASGAAQGTAAATTPAFPLSVVGVAPPFRRAASPAGDPPFLAATLFPLLGLLVTRSGPRGRLGMRAMAHDPFILMAATRKATRKAASMCFHSHHSFVCAVFQASTLQCRLLLLQTALHWRQDCLWGRGPPLSCCRCSRCLCGGRRLHVQGPRSL